MPKKKVRIAINGFGRIGRAAFKVALEHPGVEVVAINDLVDTETLAYLLQYDSVYGYYDQPVKVSDGLLTVGRAKVATMSQKDPAKLPWKKLKIDVVLECTGVFTNAKGAELHRKAGAKKVLISAPGKEGIEHTKVFGSAETAEAMAAGKVISNGSCTTNCTVPLIQVLENAFGVEKAMLSTIHAYTASQNLIDSPHKKDPRRGRSAAENIVPTSTGAAKATTKVVSSLADKFDGIAVRVPVPVGSLTDITCVLSKDVTVEQVNKAFEKATKHPLFANVLAVTDEPIVSSDIISSSYSAIVDLQMTRVVGGNLVKVLAWYDNEWGYSNRLVEMAAAVAHS